MGDKSPNQGEPMNHVREAVQLLWAEKPPGVVAWIVAVFLTIFVLELALAAPIAAFIWEKLGKK